MQISFSCSSPLPGGGLNPVATGSPPEGLFAGLIGDMAASVDRADPSASGTLLPAGRQEIAGAAVAPLISAALDLPDITMFRCDRLVDDMDLTLTVDAGAVAASSGLRSGEAATGPVEDVAEPPEPAAQEVVPFLLPEAVTLPQSPAAAVAAHRMLTSTVSVVALDRTAWREIGMTLPEQSLHDPRPGVATPAETLAPEVAGTRPMHERDADPARRSTPQVASRGAAPALQSFTPAVAAVSKGAEAEAARPVEPVKAARPPSDARPSSGARAIAPAPAIAAEREPAEQRSPRPVLSGLDLLRTASPKPLAQPAMTVPDVMATTTPGRALGDVAENPVAALAGEGLPRRAMSPAPVSPSAPEIGALKALADEVPPSVMFAQVPARFRAQAVAPEASSVTAKASASASSLGSAAAPSVVRTEAPGLPGMMPSRIADAAAVPTSFNAPSAMAPPAAVPSAPNPTASSQPATTALPASPIASPETVAASHADPIPPAGPLSRRADAIAARPAAPVLADRAEASPVTALSPGNDDVTPATDSPRPATPIAAPFAEGAVIAPAAVEGAPAAATTVSPIASAAPAATPIGPSGGVAAPSLPAVDTSRADWIETLVERFEVAREQGGIRHAAIRLTPDLLGAVEVRVHQEGGETRISFVAETAQARQMIAEAAPRLVELAESRGLKLGETLVGRSFDGAAGQGGNGGDRRGPKPDAPDAPASAFHNGDATAAEAGDLIA